MYRLVTRYLPADLKAKILHLKRVLKTTISPSIVPDVVLPQQLTPKVMDRIVQVYNSSSDAPRESISRTLMEQLALDPAYGSLLTTPYFKHRFGQEEPFQQAVAAVKFAVGDIAAALAIFETITQQHPTPFNYLCLARCFSVGLGNESQAIAQLDQALKHFPHDLSLTMNLATAHFRLGNTKTANEYLDQVRDDFVTATKADTSEVPYLAQEIATALVRELTVRPSGGHGDYYEESNIQERFWEPYWCSMNTHNRFQNGFGWINYLYQEKIRNILTDKSPQICQVINFGVMCAQPDYCLAKQFPETDFVGVDRQEITAKLNRQAYNLPNLQFIPGNIIDILPQIVKRGEPVLLFHARTATLCYPQFVRNVYKACYQHGVEYIALFENLSLSRQFMKFYDFGDMPADSIAYKSVQFIHNYEKFLNEAGYTVILSERLSASNLLDSKMVLGDTHAFLVAQRK